jgi:hypothetical protein
MSVRRAAPRSTATSERGPGGPPWNGRSGER